MTEQQKDFVHMYLKHRDKIVAHNLAYGNNSNIASVESSANRLLRIPEIADTIRSIQDNIRHEVEEEFKAKYREELLTIYEKRLLLKKIATGELYIEQKYKGKNCTQCSHYISPTINQMLAALKEDSKLAGHHPFKQNGKWVIPALQTEQEKHENPQQKTTTEIILSPAAVSQPPVGGGGGFEEAGGGIREEHESQDKTLEIASPPVRTGHPGGLQGERGIPREQLPQDENPPEKDNNLAERLNEANEKDPSERFIRAGINNRIKRQQPGETTIDNQPLTQELKTHHTPTIISQEKLRELLYPPITKTNAYGK